MCKGQRVCKGARVWDISRRRKQRVCKGARGAKDIKGGKRRPTQDEVREMCVRTAARDYIKGLVPIANEEAPMMEDVEGAVCERHTEGDVEGAMCER